MELQFFYNGQQGDEGAMVGKMKAGQLDGAALTAVGLSKVYKPIGALQMPGLFTTWAKLGTTKMSEAPNAMYHAQTKTIEVFARTDDGKLVRRFYKEKAGWSQWALLSDRGIS